MTERAYKEGGIVLVALLLSFLEFFGISALVLPLPASSVAIIITVIISVIWLLSMSLALVLAKHPASQFSLMILPPVFVVLAGRFSYGAWGGAILLILSLVVARQYYLQEIRNRITYSTVQIFRFGTKYIVVGLMLAAAGLMLPSVQSSVSADGIKIGEKQVAAVLKVTEPMVKQFIPSFSSQQNIDQFIDEQIAEQAGKGVVIPTEQKAALRAQIAKQLNQQLAGQENMSEVVTHRINDILGGFTRSNALIVSLIVIILAFFAIRTFVPIIVWPLIGLIALMVWICNALGLSKISNSQATVTRLEL